MAFIDTPEQFNEYVTVSSDFDFPKITKYTARAERNLKRILGETNYNDILDGTDEDLQNLLRDYVANMGLSYALPALKVNITNYGIKNVTTTNSDDAKWWEEKDLNRNLVKFAFTSLDQALQDFGIENVASLSDLLLASVSDFEKHYNISGSAQTFLALVPFIREAQNQYIKPVLADCYGSTDITDGIKENIQATLANIAVAKAAKSGAFSLENHAIVLRVEVLPWEKVHKTTQEQLICLADDRMKIAQGYLNNILQEVKQLPCYQETETTSAISRKPSGLYL